MPITLQRLASGKLLRIVKDGVTYLARECCCETPTPENCCLTEAPDTLTADFSSAVSGAPTDTDCGLAAHTIETLTEATLTRTDTPSACRWSFSYSQPNSLPNPCTTGEAQIYGYVYADLYMEPTEDCSAGYPGTGSKWAIEVYWYTQVCVSGSPVQFNTFYARYEKDADLATWPNDWAGTYTLTDYAVPSACSGMSITGGSVVIS